MSMSVPDKNDFIFVAAIDHRIDFIKEYVGDDGSVPSAASYEKAADLKGIVFAAIADAVESGLPKSQVAIWTDTDLGEAVLLRGRGLSITTIASVERNGPEHFQFQNALGFSEGLKLIGASYAGARINHNIEGDLAESEAHVKSLRRLSQIARSEGPPLMVELSIPPTKSQVARLDDLEEWNRDFQPAVLLETMRALQDDGVEPAIWVLDPPDQPIPASALAAQAYVDDRVDVRVLFAVGNDRADKTDLEALESAVRIASRTAGVSGLVLGPAIYEPTLKAHMAGDLTQTEAVTALSGIITSIVNQFVEAGTALDVS
jgi:myo-inositol catabolism protein IolC